MRRPRVRITIRRMMSMIVLVAILLAWGIDRSRKGRPLVQFDYQVVVENEPLKHPTMATVARLSEIVLEDGRVIRVEGGPMVEGYFAIPEDQKQLEIEVEIETMPSDRVAIYTRLQHWGCPNCMRRYVAPLRIPIYPRIFYMNYRTLLAEGRISGTDSGKDLAKADRVPLMD